jgi:hypothetical protein
MPHLQEQNLLIKLQTTYRTYKYNGLLLSYEPITRHLHPYFHFYTRQTTIVQQKKWNPLNQSQ